MSTLVYVWGTLLALSFSLLPTEEKWKNVTTAEADSKAYEPSETRWALTASAHTDSQQRERCSSPFPLSARIQISQDAQRKLTQHWLPKAHTLLWISFTAMVTLVLVTLNGDTQTPRHTGRHWGIHLSPQPAGWIWAAPATQKRRMSDLDLGPIPQGQIPVSSVYFLFQTLIWGRDQFLCIFSDLGTICISVPQNFKICFLPYVKTLYYNERLIYQNSKHYVNRH